MTEGGDVFLNLPYDRTVVDLYLAYIAGVTTLGFVPRVTLEITGGERRLDRTIELITSCPYSVHELSPVRNAGKRPHPPRLNMAFELGLAVALSRAQPGRHTWFIFETRRARLDRSLSDLAGTDAHFHNGRPVWHFPRATKRVRSRPSPPDNPTHGPRFSELAGRVAWDPTRGRFSITLHSSCI